ncbi:hypothetical protein [Pseudomonas sp. P8_250]|uniref:hypothetical protein n=1 Tax=Pseudomonas sp. P8_250 TaxID=3043446 RepID=UPI002A3719BA|nr:hypothetical protein [Pseudomonas sp. P8_250]MDX9668660.1 hypothetical protein [Pseudomonas sp. P8_250]
MERSAREIGTLSMQDLKVQQDPQVQQVSDMIAAGVRITIVKYEQFVDIEFEPPATFFTRSAMGDYYFYHSRERAKAQAACDDVFGKGRYTVNASKIQKGKGGLTCTGTQTRKGQRK